MMRYAVLLLLFSCYLYASEPQQHKKKYNNSQQLIDSEDVCAVTKQRTQSIKNAVGCIHWLCCTPLCVEDNEVSEKEIISYGTVPPFNSTNLAHVNRQQQPH